LPPIVVSAMIVPVTPELGVAWAAAGTAASATTPAATSAHRVTVLVIIASRYRTVRTYRRK
jgi:hypothetical protein